MELKTELMQHQKAAFNKLKDIKIGALYMEQGTGKTRTALEFIKYRIDENKINKVLWLCPCSVKTNLRKDIKKHTGTEQTETIKIIGIESLSSSIRIYNECLTFLQENKVMMIVDESLLIKNFKAQRTINITRLGSLALYKMILNGTPISRNEADLFSQWYFLDWRILGYRSFYVFAANHLEYDDHGRIKRILDIDRLAKKIVPYSYQVTKEECLDLPARSYREKYCELTEEQLFNYDEVYRELIGEVDEFKPATIYRFFTALSDVISGQEVKVGKHLITTPMFLNPEDNPRIQTLLYTLNEGEKTIIFCRYVHEIKAIEQVLKKEYGKNSTALFYGEVPLKKRVHELERFEKDKETQFLLANKNCAGFGLNLQFCKKIIFYSNDWDLGTRIQAEDRVHRIGQDSEVTIIDIIAVDSLDEVIMSNLSRKRGKLGNLKDEIDKDKNNLLLEIFKELKEAHKNENLHR